VNDRYSQV